MHANGICALPHTLLIRRRRSSHREDCAQEMIASPVHLIANGLAAERFQMACLWSCFLQPGAEVLSVYACEAGWHQPPHRS